MGKTVLFTPAGGTDPISNVNAHDGAMLHICRVYRPDQVVLYLSKEMLQYHQQDNRYLYCLEKLSDLQCRKMQYTIIERTGLTDVQDFDFFYDDFSDILEGIMESLGEEDTLIVNASSGTPAMKSALTVLKTIREYPYLLIQVTTPAKQMNQHDHTGYDVESLWELNEDNREDFTNRCKEVVCKTLSIIREEEIIKQHIRAYDYRAALEVAESLPHTYPAAYKKLLEMAQARYLMDIKKTDEVLRDYDMSCIPVRDGRGRKVFEYALVLEIKLKKREYADFIRAITPLIIDLFEMALRQKCKINLDDYCETRNQVRRWSRTKLSGTEVQQVLETAYQNHEEGFRYHVVYSDALKYLIDHFATDDGLKNLVRDLRTIESSVRNLAAHEIVSVTDDMLKTLTGFSAEQIMKKIQTMINYTGLHVPENAWDSYDDMNDNIIRYMRQ